MNYYEIGQRIRKIRKSKDMSQELLAEKTDISVTHMSHIETGNTKLSLPVLVKLAKTLEVSADHLIFGEERDIHAGVRQVIDIMSSCTPAQEKIITDTVRALKHSLDKNI